MVTALNCPCALGEGLGSVGFAASVWPSMGIEAAYVWPRTGIKAASVWLCCGCDPPFRTGLPSAPAIGAPNIIMLQVGLSLHHVGQS